MTGIAPVVEPAAAAPAATLATVADRAAFTASLTAALGGKPLLERFITLGQMTGAAGAIAPGYEAAAALAGLGAGAVVGPGAPAPALEASAAGAPPGGRGAAVVAAAKRYLGVPYRWGGTNPATGLDCSGFVQRVFSDLGVRLPRVSVDQARQGTKVPSLAEARPGDLVFRRGSPNHIGIYLGDGQFVHAPRTGDVVKVAPLRWTPDEIRRVA